MRIIDIGEIADILKSHLSPDDYKIEERHETEGILIYAKVPEGVQERTSRFDGKPAFDPIVGIKYNSLYSGLIIEEITASDIPGELYTHFKELYIEFIKQHRPVLQEMAGKLELNFIFPEGVVYKNQNLDGEE